MLPHKLLLYLFLPLLVGIGLTTDAQRLHPRGIVSVTVKRNLDTTAKRDDSLTSPGQSPGHSSNPCSGCKGCEETEPPPCCKNCALLVSTRGALESLLSSRSTPAFSFPSAAAAVARAHQRDIGIDSGTITATTQRDNEHKAFVEAQSERRLKGSGGDGGYGESVLVKRPGPPSCASCYGCEAYMKPACCSNCSAALAAAAPLSMGQAVEDQGDHYHHQPPHHPQPPKKPCDICIGCSKSPGERPSCCALCPHLLERTNVFTSRDNLGLEGGLNEARDKKPTPPDCPICTGCHADPPKRPSCCGKCFGEEKRAFTDATKDHNVVPRQGPGCPGCGGCDNPNAEHRPTCCFHCYPEKRVSTSLDSRPAPRKLIIGRDDFNARVNKPTPTVHEDRVRPPPHKPPKCTGCKNCDLHPPHRPACCAMCPHEGLVAADEERSTLDTEEPKERGLSTLQGSNERAAELQVEERKHHEDLLHLLGKHGDAIANIQAGDVVTVGARQGSEEVQPRFHKNPPMCKGCDCGGPKLKRPACCSHCHDEQEEAVELATTVAERKEKRYATVVEDEADLAPRKHDKPHKDPCAQCSCGGAPEVRPPCCFKCRPPLDATSTTSTPRGMVPALGKVNGQATRRGDPDPCARCLGCAVPAGFYRPACCPSCGYLGSTAPAERGKPSSEVTTRVAPSSTPLPRRAAPSTPLLGRAAPSTPSTRDSTTTMLTPRDIATALEEAEQQASERDPPPDPCESCLGCYPGNHGYRPACCASCGGYQVSMAPAKQANPVSEVFPRETADPTPLPRLAASSKPSSRDSATTTLFSRDSPILATTPVERAAGVIEVEAAEDLNERFHKTPCYACTKCSGPPPRPECCGRCASVLEATTPLQRGPSPPSLDPGLTYAKELPRGGNDPENDPCTACEDCDLPLSARPSCCGICHTSKKKERSEGGGGKVMGATGGGGLK